MLSLLELTQRLPAHVRPGPFPPFVIGEIDRDTFVRSIRRGDTPQRVVLRTAAILLADAGWTNSRIAGQLAISRRTVAFWKTRYRRGGAQAVLVDAPGRGRKPGRDRNVVARILSATRTLPPDSGRWSVRALARAVGVSHATVQRVWREHGISHRPPQQ